MQQTVSVIFIILLYNLNLYAGGGEGSVELPKGLQGITFEGLHYLKYQAGQSEDGAGNYNRFTVSRSYLTVKKKINGFISSRITLDAHQDDTGDITVRIKYVYADFKFPNFAFIHQPHLEFGLVHRPWLDFEEHINYYRMVDTMFMERAGIFNSADFGLTFAGYLGGLLNEEYQKTVNKKYPGRYGSFALGVYNGGGYHAEEENQNKSLEARLTLRPLPDYIPGLQVSGLFIGGKGNQAGSLDDIDDWMTYAVMLSYERRFFTLTGTYVTGYGNKSGSWPEEADYCGHSLFAEGKLDENWRIIGRYDHFDPDTGIDNDGYDRFIGGVGYDFGHQNILIADYEVRDWEAGGQDSDSRFQLTLQIHYY